ncbi:MAG: tape measure protein, partial [Pirellulaceae bacterium]
QQHFTPTTLTQSTTGKPINDFVRIFAKVKSTGKVSLETLNQLAERGVPIYAALGTQLGKSRTEMLSMISKGKIGFSDLDGALRSVATGAGVFAGGMQAQSESAAGLWSTLVDNLKFALREFGGLVMSAFNFKGLMKQGIGFFQTLKAGIASARPAFIATAAVVQSAFKAVWEVVSVTFEAIGSALGATGGDFMRTFVEMAAVASFAFKNWPTIAELAFTNIALFLVGLGADFLHLFTVRIPAIMGIFGTVMTSTFRTVGDFVGTVFGNMLTNIRNTMRAIWDFIASGGTAPLKLAWQPLTDGFRATVAEIPDIPDRALTDLERTLAADSERLGAALSTGLADEIAANMEMLNDFQSTRIEPAMVESVTADAITAEEAATPDTTGKKRTNFVVDSLERGSEEALNAIFANQGGDKTAEQSLKEQKQQTKALKKIAAQPTFTLNVAGVP